MAQWVKDLALSLLWLRSLGLIPGLGTSANCTAAKNRSQIYYITIWEVRVRKRSYWAEIKALAAAELNAHPRVRHYKDRQNPDSEYTVGAYEDYKDKATYKDHMIVFPYPSQQVVNSNGKLKQNEGYN